MDSGQLELISVNKDKTAKPGDMISFTNHLASNNGGARKEAARDTQTAWSLRPTQCQPNLERMVLC